jgi:esterase/lipase
MPLREDFNTSSDYIIYTTSNFIHIMAGLQLFDIEEIQKEYYSISDSLRRQADKIMHEYNEFEKNIEKIDHNFLIKSIRDNG